MNSPCIDVHVHLHPEPLARAIERHFADHVGWHCAHPFEPDQVVATLARRGVTQFCFFSYAHKPGIARSINEWIAKTAARSPGSVPLGTIHAGDDDLVASLDQALGELRLAGLKLHHSVQRFAADDPRLWPVYERLEATGRLLVTHAGTMPYRDPHTGVGRLRSVLERFPRLKVCLAHMGAFESEIALAMTDEFPNFYVDTAMTLSPLASRYVGAEPARITTSELLQHQDKILFGSDFPLIPYDYDEERRFADDRGLTDDVKQKIFFENARRFLGL